MERPSLLNYLALQMLSPIKKKGLFSGEYVLFGEYLEQTQLLFESCCSLGFTYRNNIEKFAIIFFAEGKEKNVTELFSEMAKERYKKYKPEHKNFFDFYFMTDGAEMMKKFYDYKILPTANIADFAKVYKVKVPIKITHVLLPTLCADGIAFGYKYPELVENFFSFVHDEEKWKMMYKAGLDIGSEPPKIIPLSTMQVESKEMIKPFVERHYPELLTALNFK